MQDISEFDKHLLDKKDHCPDCEKIAKYTDGFVSKCRKHMKEKWFYDKVLNKNKELDKILKEFSKC